MAATTDPAPFSVDGKTAIITGGGSGIGYCFVKVLLQENCNVVIADLSLRPEAQKLVDEYSSTEPGKPRCIFVKTDVVQWPDLDQMFEVAEQEFGGADIVCPGAGVYEPHWSNFWIPPGTGASTDIPTGAGHYATLDINLTHPIRTTQLAISKWLNPDPATTHKPSKASPSNPKRIVHITSIAGQVPGFSTPLYQASKHALSGFIRSLAQLDSTLGIRVNGVAPGLIKTPLWTEHPEKLKMFDENVDDWVLPEEVAEAMLRCCEDGTVGGGVVMEVLKGKTRRVDWRNDPGPSGPGGTASTSQSVVAEALGWLADPGWGLVRK